MSQIEKLRATEYKYLARNLYIVAVSTFLLWTSPAIVAIATFTTCVLLGVPLTPGRVLSTTATLLVLRMPLQNLSDFVAILAQAKVSLHRLLLFSQEPELLTDTVVRGSNCELHDCAIEVENGTFSWHTEVGEEMIPPTLRGVNLRVRKGAHVAVCGPVGSGKSALLSCMLGEIPKVEGRVRSLPGLLFVTAGHMTFYVFRQKSIGCTDSAFGVVLFIKISKAEWWTGT